MRPVSHRIAGLTLVETLVALLLVILMGIATASFILPSLTTDQNAKQRTLALRAAETWLDRYRANQEPKASPPASCAVSGSSVVCTYAYGYAYPSSEWAAHTPQLATSMSPFRHILTLTLLSGGTPGSNVAEWSATAQVFWKQATVERSVTLSTRFTQ